MENQQRKWVVLSYAAFSALIAYVIFALMVKGAASFDLEARVRNADVIIQAVAAAVGLILFGWLFRHAEANLFMEEVFGELGRVTWPVPQETYKATIVVLVMVMLSGMILGGYDTVWVWLLKFVL